MTRPIRLARIIGAAALALLLGACSALQLGYSNLPQVAYWWLDGYFDFTDSQTPRVKESLEQFHQWHRSQELPRVVTLLRQAEQMVAGELTGPQVCAVVEAGRARVQAAQDQLEPVLAGFAPGLEPAQLRHLAQRYERNLEDFRKDWVRLGPAERQDKRFKLFVERLEMAYGRLDEPQRAVLRRQLDALPFDPVPALAERQRRQADALEVLRQLQAPGTTPAQAARQLRELFARTQASPDPAYRQVQAQTAQGLCGVVAAVHNATTPAQREAAARRLRGWQQDFTTLAARR